MKYFIAFTTVAILLALVVFAAADPAISNPSLSFGQAPGTQQEFDAMKEEQRQESELDSFHQARFNRDIARQGGRPSPDKTYRERPVLGYYNPNGNFVRARLQPVHRSIMPGAPVPMTFPQYERQLQASFKQS